MNVTVPEVRRLLERWCDARQELYALVFEKQAMQSCTGHVIEVNDTEAVVSDSICQLRVPDVSALEADATSFHEEVKSLTLTMLDLSAFFITR